MTRPAELVSEPRSFLKFLAKELAPWEGRGPAVVRIGICCAITVMVAMTFQIPLPAYMAYVVLLISKDEQGGTAKTAIGGLVAVTLAVGTCLLLFTVDAGEPALRIPAMAFCTFIAMYTARILALGPISFLMGFVLVMVQSLVDDVPNLEALTHITLWLWIVVLVPVSVSMVAGLLFGPGTPTFIQRTVLRVLAKVESSILNGGAQASFADERADVLRILGLLGAQPARARSAQVVTKPSLLRLLDALTMLEHFRGGLPPPRVQRLAQRVRTIRFRIEAGEAGRQPEPPALDTAAESPFILSLDNCFKELEHHLGQAPSQPAALPRNSFVPDAFSNPEYLRFAFRTTVAVMAVYAIYTMLDYPGMRTAITTCFFVSLGTLGESVHKLLLRVSGALIGGVLAAICIVFVLPSLTDIGQLALLIAGVAAACAWIALGSERLSYGGLQVAFAFFLGVLQGYTPATDLTVLRDRVAGIVLGNVVITLVFTLMWPESAATRVRAALADFFRAIASLLRSEGEAGDEARLQLATALTRIDKYSLLHEFELHILPASGARRRLRHWLPRLDGLATATLVASSSILRPPAHPQAMDARARWADAAADSVLKSVPLPPAPLQIEKPSAASVVARGAIERAALQLQAAIEDVFGASA